MRAPGAAPTTPGSAPATPGSAPEPGVGPEESFLINLAALAAGIASIGWIAGTTGCSASPRSSSTPPSFPVRWCSPASRRDKCCADGAAARIDRVGPPPSARARLAAAAAAAAGLGRDPRDSRRRLRDFSRVSGRLLRPVLEVPADHRVRGPADSPVPRVERQAPARAAGRIAGIRIAAHRPDPRGELRAHPAPLMGWTVKVSSRR